MIDPVTLLDILFAAMAILAGLASRNVATSIVAGCLIALVHGGLVALVGAQSGKFDIAECPYVKEAVDYAMTSGYLTFAHARYVSYLVLSGIAMMVATIVSFFVRWVSCRIICAVMPKDATTPTTT